MLLSCSKELDNSISAYVRKEYNLAKQYTVIVMLKSF